MATITTDPISTTEAHAAILNKESRRCHHRFNNGMRCRLPASPSHSGFCPQHFRESLAGRELPNDATDLSADLLPGGLSQFSSAQDIRQFLARLLAQVTKGGISPRRAAVLAFITNQLLHSHRAIQRRPTRGRRKIFDIPRPQRD